MHLPLSHLQVDAIAAGLQCLYWVHACHVSRSYKCQEFNIPGTTLNQRRTGVSEVPPAFSPRWEVQSILRCVPPTSESPIMVHSFCSLFLEFPSSPGSSPQLLFGDSGVHHPNKPLAPNLLSCSTLKGIQTRPSGEQRLRARWGAFPCSPPACFSRDRLGGLSLHLSCVMLNHICSCFLLINTIWCYSVGLCSCK